MSPGERVVWAWSTAWVIALAVLYFWSCFQPEPPAPVTDCNSHVTRSQYDELNRLTQVTFQDTSTVAYTYDARNRITQIVDSANGTITRQYDGLDRVMPETTPEGVVNYT